MKQKHFSKTWLLAAVPLLLVAALMVQNLPVAAAPAARNPGPLGKETLRIIKQAQEIYVYTYAQKISLDVKKDRETIRRVSDRNLVASFRTLIEDNSVFQPRYRKRCLPIYDYGIEFRAHGKTRTFLFSFRCNTMRIHEDNVYRDFSRERTRLYALLKYEVNELTTVK